MKVCSKCGQEKPQEEFSRGGGPRHKPGYRRTTCKQCEADYMARRRVTDPAVRARAAARYEATQRLIALNPLLYQVIHEEELQKRGLS